MACRKCDACGRNIVPPMSEWIPGKKSTSLDNQYVAKREHIVKKYGVNNGVLNALAKIAAKRAVYNYSHNVGQTVEEQFVDIAKRRLDPELFATLLAEAETEDEESNV